VAEDEPGPFRVRCRDCGRTVLTGVLRIADAEARALRAHSDVCRPDLVDGSRTTPSASLGSLLAHFDVRSV
jgi:hypothetical protein